MKAKVPPTGHGFLGATDYAFNGKKGEINKDGRIIATNLSGKTENEIASEFNFVWHQRQDIKKPVWTASLNLVPGEHLSDEKWGVIAKEFLEEMGIDLKNHQYLIVIHNDKEHQHVHLVVNRIGYDGSVYLNQKSAMKALTLTPILEKKHNLIETKAYEGDNGIPSLTNNEFKKAKRTGIVTPRIRCSDIVVKAKSSSKSFSEFVSRLKHENVKIAPNGKTGSVSGVSFEYEKEHFTGSKLGDACKWKSIAEAVGYNEEIDALLVSQLRAMRDAEIEADAKVEAERTRKNNVVEVLDAVLGDLFNKQTYTTPDAIDKAVGDCARTFPKEHADVVKEIKKQFNPLGKNADGILMYTSADIIKREHKAIVSAQLLKTDTHHDIGCSVVEAAIMANSYVFESKESQSIEISIEQRTAIVDVFKSGYSNFKEHGRDAAFALGCVRIGYEQYGYQVIGATATGSAASFERSTGIPSSTLSKLLSDIKFNNVVLDKKSVVVVENIAKASFSQFSEIVKLCEKAGSKLITTGADRLHVVSDGIAAPGVGQMATEILISNSANYFSKIYGNGPSPKVRAKRDEVMDEEVDEVKVAAEVETYESVLKKAETKLFSADSAITLDRLEEVMTEIDDISPEFSDKVREQIKSDFVKCGVENGLKIFTTKEILEREKLMVQCVRTLSHDVHHNLDLDEIKAAIQKKEIDASIKTGRKVKMTEEQSDAVNWSFRGGYASLQGSAGAGKSFAMEVVKIGYEERGYKVYGAAISRRASQNLEDETGIKSCTVAKMLSEIKKGNIELDSKTCLIIDEAGQVGTGYLASLVEQCRDAGAKIVFTGEDKQLDAIQHGGALRFLSRADIVGTARIEAIQRQEETWAKQAVMNYRDGKMEEGLAAFEARGLITMKRGGAEATQEALISDWREYELEARAAHAADPSKPQRQSLILAHSNATARELGDLVRTIRKQEGAITGSEFTLKAAHGDKAYDLTLAAGDRVRFNKNDEKDVGVINGSLGTILSIEELPGVKKGKPDYLIRAMTDDRGEVEFRASNYADEKGRVLMGQAYAMTVYSSQGVTVNGDVFVLQSEGMDRANTYVANSRARADTHTYVDRDAYAAAAKHSGTKKSIRDVLISSMKREASKRLAIEYLCESNNKYIVDEIGVNEISSEDEVRKLKFNVKKVALA